MEEIENKGDAAQCCARVATKGLSSFSGVGKGKAARRKEETQRRRITGIRVSADFRRICGCRSCGNKIVTACVKGCSVGGDSGSLPFHIDVQWVDVDWSGMKELIEEIAKALADHPEDVRVTVMDGAHMSVFEIRTHPLDLGNVIDRQGRTINGRRTLLAAAGANLKKRISLDVIQDEESGSVGDSGAAGKSREG